MVNGKNIINADAQFAEEKINTYFEHIFRIYILNKTNLNSS